MPLEKLWETEEDRKKEKEIAEFFARHWTRRLEKIEGNHVIDYCFHVGLSDAVNFYGECKNKGHRYGAFPDVFCGLKKLHFADAQRAHGIQTKLLVRWKCGTHGWTYLEKPDEIIFGGRIESRMRNGEDREPVGVYKIDRFSIIQSDRQKISDIGAG